MADTSIDVTLKLIADDAIREAKAATKQIQGQLSSISFASSFNAAVTGISAVTEVVGKAVGYIEDVFSKAIEEASQAEEASFRLANALRLVGGYSQQSVKDFEALAKQIQATTTFSANQVLAAAGLAKQFQLTNAEVKKLIPVAADLAIILGEDIGTSATRLARTLNGDVDKALLKNITGLKGLTFEQKNAGQALDIIAGRVRDTAQAFTGTFAGALAQAKNSFNDVFETLGKSVVENTNVIEAIKKIGETFGEVAIVLATLTPQISLVINFLAEMGLWFIKIGAQVAKATTVLVNGFLSGLQFMQGIIAKSTAAIRDIVLAIFTLGLRAKEAGDSFRAAFASLNPLNFIRDWQAAQKTSNSFWDPIIRGARNAQNALAETKAEAKKAVVEATPEGNLAAEREREQKRQEILNEFNSKRKELVQAGLTDIQKAEQSAASSIELVNKAAAFGIIKTHAEKAKLIKAIEDDLSKKVIDLKKQEAEKIKQNTQAFATDVGGSIAGAITSGQGINERQQAAAGTGLLNSMLKGAEGASKLISGFIGGIFDTILPGIGGVVSEIVGILGQGPEKVKQMITDFVKAVPEFIKNFITAIPVLITELSKAVPSIIRGILSAIPEIISALIKAMPEVALALSGAMPTVAIAFVEGLIQNIPKMVTSFATEFMKIPERFVKAILDIIPGGSKVLGSSGGGGIIGGVTSFFGKIGDFLGFEQGGRIPDVPSLMGDRALIKANAGEQILSRDLSKQLETFLDGQGSQPVVVNLVVGQQQLARAMFDLNRGGFRTS